MSGLFAKNCLLTSHQKAVAETVVTRIRHQGLTWLFSPHCAVIGSREGLHVDWHVSVLSKTHHTQNVVMLCAPVSSLEEPSSFVLKVEVQAQIEPERILREARFYQQNQGPHFPKLLGIFTWKPILAIALEYLGTTCTLGDYLWDPRLGRCYGAALLVKVIDFLSNHLFTSRIRTPSLAESHVLFRSLFIDRIRVRFSLLQTAEGIIEGLFRSRLVRINGHTCYGPSSLLERSQENVEASFALLPRIVGCIHGDPHLGNILLYPCSLELNSSDLASGPQMGSSPLLWLIDPGSDRLGPLLYDLAKLYQSLWGHYEAIMRQAFWVELTRSAEYRIDFDEPPHFVHFRDLLRDLVGNLSLPAYPSLSSDRLHSACLLAAGLHLIAAAPHHVNRITEAQALLLTGTLLANEGYGGFEQRPVGG